MDVNTWKLIMTGATIAIGGALPALAIGMITAKAVESIGRNPEAVSDIRTSMILGMAFAEAIAIYALVIALIIKFV
jgi:F-type H+-transporting ATPase subunit c